VVSTSVLKVYLVLDFAPSVSLVELVNDVLSKGKYFNPQGWKIFGEALREANVPQDLIGHEDRWNDNRVHPLLDRTAPSWSQPLF
jgi:hypothetical protein